MRQYQIKITELAEQDLEYAGNYKIYYVIEENTIYIIRILHMLVDSKAWLYQTLGL